MEPLESVQAVTVQADTVQADTPLSTYLKMIL